MLEQFSSVLAAAVLFGLLVLLRLRVFRWLAEARGRKFCPCCSVRIMLAVVASVAVPGLGQVMRGRMITAFIHLGVFVLVFASLGEVAFFINLASAMEHGFN